MTHKVLIVAAHADDEALGCGGAMARHADDGDEVHVVFMADGVGSRGDGVEALQHRNEAAEKACRALGVKNVTYLALPDNKMDSLPLLSIVQELEKVIQSVQPGTIYTHHYGDLNVDHQLTHQVVMTACRPQPHNGVKRIYTFEILSSTEWQTAGDRPFLPTRFVDITRYMDRKIEALQAYAMEMRPSPHSRSLENVRHLAGYRGHCVGVSYAEAFMIARELV